MRDNGDTCNLSHNSSLDNTIQVIFPLTINLPMPNWLLKTVHLGFFMPADISIAAYNITEPFGKNY
jgi:hypothetical protein